MLLAVGSKVKQEVGRLDWAVQEEKTKMPQHDLRDGGPQSFKTCDWLIQLACGATRATASAKASHWLSEAERRVPSKLSAFVVPLFNT